MNTQKPTLVSVIAWMTLASGIVNLFWGVAASGAALATFIGFICTPITILPTILGIFEIIYAAKLFSNPAQPVKPSTNIAIFEIACIVTGNVFSMAVGILSLVFYNEVAVKDYFASLNGTLPAEPATPPTPASTPDPEPAPVISSPAQTEEPAPQVDPTPPAEENPVKPKRSPRKLAGK